MIQITAEAQSAGPFDNSCEFHWCLIGTLSLIESTTGNLVPLEIFNMIETNTGIVLACLPSMWPLLRVLRWHNWMRATGRDGLLVDCAETHDHQPGGEGQFENNRGNFIQFNSMVPTIEPETELPGPMLRAQTERHPRGVRPPTSGRGLYTHPMTSNIQKPAGNRMINLPSDLALARRPSLHQTRMVDNRQVRFDTVSIL